MPRTLLLLVIEDMFMPNFAIYIYAAAFDMQYTENR